MCCFISGEPTEDPSGRLKVFHGSQQFQRSMLWAPCANFSSFGWFCGQFIPLTCGCTQCLLRRKILDRDMTKYTCFQGYFNFCCVQAGSCGEQNCPDFCAFLEGCLCNCIAVSANRAYVMDQYDLTSDPCDYRLIRINNCLQVLSCVCNLMAIFIEELRTIARLIDRIADLFYHCVSGCMTAQTAYEVDYRRKMADPAHSHPLQYSPPQHPLHGAGARGGGHPAGPMRQATPAEHAHYATAVVAEPLVAQPAAPTKYEY